VQLCHVHQYWQKELSDYRRQQLQDRNRWMFENVNPGATRWSGRRPSIRGGVPGKKWGQAAFLANEKLKLMESLLKPEKTSADSPDNKLHMALWRAIWPLPEYWYGQFALAAFEGFDASSELQDTADKIADRWRKHYSEARQRAAQQRWAE